MSTCITAYQGRAGDRNNLAAPGALALAAVLAKAVHLPLHTIGQPSPALNTDWATELAAARCELEELAQHTTKQLESGSRPITVLTRCAAAIATLPRIAAEHPDVCVVWFDAHADLNTPASSSTGYLGGLALSASTGLWTSGFGGHLPLSSIVLVGSRDLDPFERELVSSGKVCLVAPDAVDLSSSVLEAVAGRKIYVHLDCDVLEPGLVPTDFRVPDGLSLEALKAVCSALARLPQAGLEIAELQYSDQADFAPANFAGLLDAIEPLVSAALRHDASSAFP